MKKTIKISKHELYRLIRETINEVFNDSILLESNTNRIKYYVDNFDCAFITAFRNQITDIANPDNVKDLDANRGKSIKRINLYTREKKLRNIELKKLLMNKGYFVTKLHGIYPEGMSSEGHEESFCVVNANNDRNFKDEIFKLSELYNQDSFYYKPKGKPGYLIGTNDSWPGIGNSTKDDDPGEFMSGVESNYMSRIGNQPFAFIGKNAVYNNSKEEAMQQIQDEQGTENDGRQHYWKPSGNSGYPARKAMRTALYNKNLQNASQIQADRQKRKVALRQARREAWNEPFTHEDLDRIKKLIHECIRKLGQ